MLEIELAINAQQVEYSDSSFHLNCIVTVVKAGSDGDTIYELLNHAHVLIQKRKTSTAASKVSASQQDMEVLLNKIQDSNRVSRNSAPEAV